MTTPDDHAVAVTGAAGYIGSHAAKLLLEAGARVLAIDNLDRGAPEAVETLHALAPDRLAFLKADIADRETIAAALKSHGVRSVLHFAALAYVRESVERPLDYHAVNTAGAIRLLQATGDAGVTRFVLSSTCAVYGVPPASMIPITEDAPTSPINPYGASKLAFERVLRDHAAMKRARGEPFAFAALRYFNVAGADPGGLLGENHDPETHIIPSAILAALGRTPPITLHGTDHPTPDGTAVRDYIHVADLARAHTLALDALDPAADERSLTLNLGLGRGVSLREILQAVERVVGTPVPITEAPRHPADPPTLTADATRAREILGWTPEHTDLEATIRHAHDWLKRKH